MTKVKTGAVTVRKPGDNGDLQAITAGGVGSIQQLLQLAIERGAGVEALEKLVGLHERVTAREAALEFARQLADFQAKCPPIGKTKTAKIVTKGGGSYSYQYAPLEEIVRTVKPLLVARGFSYGWDAKVDERGQMLTCTCTLRHINGHRESSGFSLPVENPSAMSPQQKVGAALTFSQRYSLVAVLGLNTTEEDSDGVAREIDPTPINPDQLLELDDLVAESGTDRARFLKYLAIDALENLPAARYTEAKAALLQKGRKRA